jgi:hypothetical protein
VKEIMALASVVYDHPTRLAQALQDVSTERGPRLSRIPYNRFAEPKDQTTWWLSPESDNPAYQWGKIVVTNADVAPNLFVGLYVEKGVGKTAAPAFSGHAKGERMIMRGKWVWHDFSRALGDGAFESEVRSASDQIGTPMLLALDAQVATPTSDWNEERYKLPRDYIRFAIGDRLVLENPAKERDLLESFNKAVSLRDISECISALPQLDWIWIDVYAGYTFAAEPQDGLPAYDTEAVWDAAGKPWRGWLREAR